jgi:uncharacterized lipoprotein YddW (UPF0748 family)
MKPEQGIMLLTRLLTRRSSIHNSGDLKMNKLRAARCIVSYEFKGPFIVCLLALLLGFSPLDAQVRKSTAANEVRGVWVHPLSFGTGKDSSIVNIRRTLDSYREAGINTVMLLVKSTSGLVCYNSAIAPVDPAWKWDFVGTFLDEAKNRDIIVHPWFCIFTEGAKAGVIRDHPEWLVRGKGGELTGVVNPALPEVRKYEISLITEFVKIYPVSWVHCDYIRYPCEPVEPYFSFDQETRDRFKLLYGEDPSSIKHNNSGNTLWNEWIEWNGEHVTHFIRELRTALKATPHTVQISAAVFPDAAISKVLIGQDWAQWAREQLVDLFCPMLYTNDDSLFVKYLRRSLEHMEHQGHVCAGIGISTAHNKNSPAGVARQIGLAKREKASGFVLFSSVSLKAEFLEKIGQPR